MITIAGLLAEPSLQLELAAGHQGLGNAVAAAHVSELTRPSSWLHGGELLMTVGLFLARGPVRLPPVRRGLRPRGRERPGPGTGSGPAAPGRPRLGELHVSARQADSLAQVSAHLGRLVQAEESSATQLLLQLGPPELLTSYSDAVLASLDAVEGPERAESLHTLEEWLRVNGAWEPAAAALSVHRNTVRNRIARVAALLGRPLDRADERMELWLALQARAAVRRAPLAGTPATSCAPERL